MEEKKFVNQLQPGMKVGKYQIVALVATGGMSMLYKAYDKTLDRYVAVKQIAPNLAADEKFVERFRREAQVLARVSQGQQNVVAVYELVEEGGGLFMIMEYVEGTSLETLMDRGAASLQTGLGILLKVALGLKAIHTQGLVHRDLKPGNVMVQPSGGVKIADFGLIGRAGGRTSLPMGTTQYMAPEMFAGGTVDGRADIYSLGFVAYQMFVGPERFREIFADVLADPQSANIRWMHWHSNPQLKAPALREVQPGIPPLVARIVERMMDKDAGRRFSSADQIIKWLRQIFVMYVQGKSLSEQDSARLEQEVDQEIEGETVPARAAAAAPATRGATVPATTEGAEAPATPMKTAPLPRRPWHWPDYARWGGIAAGVIVLGLIVWGIIAHIQGSSREAQAKRLIDEGKQFMLQREFGKASAKFSEVSSRFPDLATQSRRADFWNLMASAEQAIVAKDWQKADQFTVAMGKLADEFPDRGSKDEARRLVGEVRNRISNTQHYDNLVKDAKQAEAAGQFQAAIDAMKRILEDSVAPDPKYVEREIARLTDRLHEKQADEKIADGDAMLARGKVEMAQLDQAMVSYDAARAIYDSEKVRAKIAAVRKGREILQLVDEVEAEIEKENWGVAAQHCDRIQKLLEELDSTQVRVLDPAVFKIRADSVQASSLFQQAEARFAEGKFDEARTLLVEVRRISPGHQKAADLLRRIDLRQEYDTLLKEAADLERKGDIDGAIDKLKQILPIETDEGERRKIETRIKDLALKQHRQRFNQALRQQRWDDARKEVEAMEAAGADRGEVERMFRWLERVQAYETLYKDGLEMLDRQDFDGAKEKFRQASQIPVDRQKTQQALDMMDECDYQKFMKQGRDAKAKGNLGEAKGYFVLAQKKKDTEEVRKELEQLDR